MHFRALGVILALLVAVASGCKRAPPKQDPGSAQQAPLPVPAPDGLIAELVVPHPDRTWEATRATLGNMPLVPTSPAVFLADALALPVAALDQLDLVVPIVGAVADFHGELAVVAGIHVKDGARFVELVTAPSGGRFKKADGADGLTQLVPTGKESPWSYAVSGNYLLLAQEPEALHKLGSYVARTVPSRPSPAEDAVVTVSHRALAGPVSERLKKLWDSWKQDRENEDVAMRAKHGGSAPDFGDPAQALADIDSKAAKFFTVLGDLEEARLALVVEPKSPDLGASYRATVSMKPLSASGPAGQEIASMPVASAEPLLSLPASVAVGLLTRDSAELRAEASSAQVEAIAKVLGGRLDVDDKGKIDTAFRSWSKGRGDWLTVGLLWAGSARAAVLRGSVTDPAELGRGTTAMLKLLSVRAIAEPLSNWVGDMKVSGLPTGVAGDGAVQTVHVVRRPPKVQLRRGKDKPRENDTFDIVWSVGKELFFGAAGPDAKGAYASLQKADQNKTLARVPFLARAVDRLGQSVSFALVVDPARLTDAVSGDSDGSAFLLSYGKDRRDQAWFELTAPSSVVLGLGALLGGVH